MSKSNGDILKKAGLRVTPFREKVLKVFQSNPHAAVRNHDLEKQIGQHDRITLYRTLRSFEEKHIIHKVSDSSNDIKYALCHQDCEIHRGSVNHPHFLCTNCEQTYCLESLGELSINLPENYTLNSIQVALSGICAQCS